MSQPKREIKLYFEHREYKGLIFQYVGPLYYPDGRKVEEWVSVKCLNDLGLRAYKTNAYCAVAKSLLTPYRGTLPSAETKHTRPAIRRPASPSERIEKSSIRTRAGGKGNIGMFGDDEL